MSFDEGLYAWVQEALEPMGTVSLRKMMGGAMLYCDGLVFALLYGDAIWFKADGDSDALWDAQGCERFTIAFKDGRVEQSNFHDYPVLRMSEMPMVEVHLVPGGEKPTGVGEPGTPPTAPAVANALFALTGKPVRTLPLGDIKWA